MVECLSNESLQAHNDAKKLTFKESQVKHSFGRLLLHLGGMEKDQTEFH